MARMPAAVKRDTTDRERRYHVLAVSFGALITTLLLALGLGAHRALRTNAFDLSVFDYALWCSIRGDGLGYVPMFSHSLFAQHTMPSLLLLAPLTALFEGPQYLLVSQVSLFGAAGYVLYRLARLDLPGLTALAITVAFMLCRRSQSAVNSFFYIESAEPVLLFCAVLAWRLRRTALFLLALALAVGCKEDVALYVLMFAILVVRPGGPKWLTWLIVSGCTVWLLLALFVVIPAFREIYALPRTSVFLEGRFGYRTLDISFVAAACARIFSLESAKTLFGLLATTAGLALLAPRWLAVVLPAVIVSLAALPGTGERSFLGHYAWPVLPWLFLAAIDAARRVSTSAPRLARWLPAYLAIVAVADSPLPRTTWKALQSEDRARAAVVLEKLKSIPAEASVAAQPNLIPHLPRRLAVRALGVYESDGPPHADYVLLTRVGDLWPFDAASVGAREAALKADPNYQALALGEIAIFRRRPSIRTSTVDEAEHLEQRRSATYGSGLAYGANALAQHGGPSRLSGLSNSQDRSGQYGWETYSRSNY